MSFPAVSETPKLKEVSLDSAVKAPSEESEALWFSYVKNEGKLNAVGTQSIERYDCAIKIPDAFAGKTIDAIAFYIYNRAVLDDVYCWATEQLPSLTVNEYTGEVTSIVPVEASNLIHYQNGPNIVEIPSFIVPDEGCYVGYSFSVNDVSDASGQLPVIYCYNQVAVDGAMYMRTSATTFSTWRNFNEPGGEKPGNLVIMARVNGKFYSNAVRIDSAADEAYINKNSTKNIPVTITGLGKNIVKNLSYTENGGAETTVALDSPVGMGMHGTVMLPLSSGDESGVIEKTLTITKVNGAIADIQPETDIKLTVLSQKVPRKVVVETIVGTGLECSPLEITAMEKLREQFPRGGDDDIFIGHSIHLCNQDDPMFAEDFAPIADFYPMENYIDAMLNREIISGESRVTDVWFGTKDVDFGIKDDIRAIADKEAIASVKVKPSWDKEGKSVNAETEVTFYLDGVEASNYAIGYVLTEDVQSNDHYLWRQLNFFNGLNLPEDDPFYYWSIQPKICEGVEYKNVAIAKLDSLRASEVRYFHL